MAVGAAGDGDEAGEGDEGNGGAHPGGEGHGREGGGLGTATGIPRDNNATTAAPEAETDAATRETTTRRGKGFDGWWTREKASGALENMIAVDFVFQWDERTMEIDATVKESPTTNEAN